MLAAVDGEVAGAVARPARPAADPARWGRSSPRPRPGRAAPPRGKSSPPRRRSSGRPATMCRSLADASRDETRSASRPVGERDAGTVAAIRGAATLGGLTTAATPAGFTTAARSNGSDGPSSGAGAGGTGGLDSLGRWRGGIDFRVGALRCGGMRLREGGRGGGAPGSSCVATGAREGLRMRTKRACTRPSRIMAWTPIGAHALDAHGPRRGLGLEILDVAAAPRGRPASPGSLSVDRAWSSTGSYLPPTLMHGRRSLATANSVTSARARLAEHLLEGSSWPEGRAVLRAHDSGNRADYSACASAPLRALLPLPLAPPSGWRMTRSLSPRA